MSDSLRSKALGHLTGPLVRLAMLDKKVIQALANNSHLNLLDEAEAPVEVRNAIAAFVACALKVKDVESLVARYSLTLNELNSMYWAGVHELLPNPQITVTARMLAPSLLFIEPIRLREVVEVALKHHAEEAPESPRLEFLEDCAAEAAAATKHAHDAANPPPAMPAPGAPVVSRAGGGCALVFIAVGIGAWLN